MASASGQDSILIIGAGQAGVDTASALRQQGFEGAIRLIGDEPQLPYRRPPLSKDLLLGKVTPESLTIRQAAGYEKLDIALELGVGVERIEREYRQVQLFDGRRFDYDRLVLACGSRARHLRVPGSALAGVQVLRSLADAERLRTGWRAGQRLVIVGGGYIGLEAAAAARELGLEVSLVESRERLLSRVAPAEIADFYLRWHRARGVVFHLSAAVAAFEGETQVQSVRLSDGQTLAADWVIVGIGGLPNSELAALAGLEVREGIVTDAQMRTKDSAIWAIGDCALPQQGFYETPLRLESVPAAQEQARIAAASILGKTVAAGIPWFWSDQGGVKLQSVGRSDETAERIWRGQRDGDSFILFEWRAGVIRAAFLVNRPQELVVIRRLAGEKVMTDPAALTDENVPLKSLLPPQAIGKS